MEEELNTTANPEVVEDMPDFEETTEETADADTTDTKTDDKGEDKTEKKATKQGFKSNLPTGFSFNPLVFAIKPFYDKLVADDEIFARVVKERESRAEKPKSLAECAEYIISECYNYASKHRNGQMGLAGFPDEEMYRLIQHYYDEEFIEVKPMRYASVSVSHTAPTPTSTAKPTATPAKKPEKKGKEKEKPVKNVLDITKAIKANTGTETGKKAKKKDSLSAGFVPMERPNTEKEAKKGSRQQAKSVEQLDMFADFFAQ